MLVLPGNCLPGMLHPGMSVAPAHDSPALFPLCCHLTFAAVPVFFLINFFAFSIDLTFFDLFFFLLFYLLTFYCKKSGFQLRKKAFL
jgi:hypothetical protein